MDQRDLGESGVSPESVRQCCTRFIANHRPESRRPRDVILELMQAVSEDEEPDHYGRGTIIENFELRVAEYLGKPSAIFFPTGTMAQQIALRLWCEEQKSARVFLHQTSHVFLHEELAIQHLHNLKTELIGRPDRCIKLEDLATIPRKSTVLLEIPQRELGGYLPNWEDVVQFSNFIRSRDSRIHLDGARLWECMPAYQRPAADLAALFDSVYVSFYKTLGAVGGAILAGPSSFIEKARVWQRRHGGNLIALWPYVVSARRAMDLRLDMVPIYVDRMREIAHCLRESSNIDVVPCFPKTNLAHLRLRGTTERLVEAALVVSQRSGVWLFSRLLDDHDEGWARFEFVVGDATLELTPSEIRDLLEEVIDVAAGMEVDA